MNEPTLKEIESAADAGLSGVEPSVVSDNSKTLELINQNAQFKAQNDWNKYKQFLDNYETRLKSVQDLAGKEVSEEDRPYLKQKTTELLSGMLDSPRAIYSPEFNQKLANLTQEATSSKLKNDFGKQNRLFLAANPTFITEENEKMVQDLSTQTLEKGGWKPYMLKPPADVLDRGKFFEGIANQSYTDKPYAFQEGANDYEGVDRTYDFARYKQLVENSWADPKVRKIAEKDFADLDPQTRGQFDDAKEYWTNYGSLYWKDKTFSNYTERQKATVKSNPNYLEREKLNLEIRKQKNAEKLTTAQIKALEAKGVPPTAPVHIDYWAKRVLPQISDATKFNKKDTKSWWFKNDINNPKDYTGDVEISSTDLAGLDVVTFGETNEDNKPLSVNEKSKIKIKYENGKPAGISIDGKYFDSKSINQKAYQMHDKFVNGKWDTSPLAEIISENANQVGTASSVATGDVDEFGVKKVKQ